MQEVARAAVPEYIERHSKADLLDRVLDEEIPHYAEALDRLGRRLSLAATIAFSAFTESV